MPSPERNAARVMVDRFARMRLDHPDFETFQVLEPSTDARVKVRKPHWPAGKFIKVPAQNLRDARSYTGGAGAVVGYEEGNRQLPFLQRLGAFLGAVVSTVVAELVIWAQGAGNAFQRFCVNDTSPPWVPVDEEQEVIAESGEENLAIPPLGLIVVRPENPLLVWLYQQEVFTNEVGLILQAYSLVSETVEWTLELDPADRYPVPFDPPPDLRWGWLFFDEGDSSLVVLDQTDRKKAYRVSLDGSLLATLELDYYLYQSCVYGGVIVKGWHYHRSDATVNSWPQNDAKIRGFTWDEETWEWNPIDSVPEGVSTPQICSTGRVFNPYGTSPFLQEGRWPVWDGNVLVWTAGWDMLESTDTSKLIPLPAGSGISTNQAVTQASASSTIGRRVWNSLSAIALEDGSAAWADGTVWEAEGELVEDSDTLEYWDTKLGDDIDHASPLDSVFWSDGEDAYLPLTVTGSVITYGGMATHLSLDRQLTFEYHYAPTGNPSEGLEVAVGNYQYTVGTSGMPPGTLARSTTLKRPDLYYFPYSSVQLMPRTAVHMETGSFTFEKGEDLVDAGETRDDSAPHQVVVDSEGNTYSIYRRPKTYRIGSNKCLQEFDGEHMDGDAPIRDWKYWQIGEIRQSWITILEKRSSAGALLYQKDISYYFEVTYRGLPL